MSRGDFMAKSGHTSAKSGESLGEKPDDLDRLYKELAKVGKRPYPLDSAAFIEQECPHLLACPAVKKYAGQGASTHQLAEAACEALRHIILAFEDETYRRIAEAAFAVDKTYQGKPIYERQELFTKSHGISVNIYAEHRREVFTKISFELRRKADSDAPSWSDPVRLVPVPTYQVARRASQFYFACVATRLINEELPKLQGNRPNGIIRDNPELSDCHIAFLLKTSHYLYLHPQSQDELVTDSLQQLLGTIVENGPFRDVIYLAYAHADPREDYSSPYDLRAATHRVWTGWYDCQCSDRPNTGAELEAITKALAEFRHALPTSSLDPRAADDSEVKAARSSARAVFDSAVTSLDRELYLPRYGEHGKWLSKMNRRLDHAVRKGLDIKGK
jgi:hypothetical protein